MTRRPYLIQQTGLTVLLLCLPCSMALVRAQDEDEAVSSEPKKATTEVIFKEQDLERIQQRLDELTGLQQQLRQAIEEIKAELSIIKVRVTN